MIQVAEYKNSAQACLQKNLLSFDTLILFLKVCVRTLFARKCAVGQTSLPSASHLSENFLLKKGNKLCSFPITSYYYHHLIKSVTSLRSFTKSGEAISRGRGKSFIISSFILVGLLVSTRILSPRYTASSIL